MGTTLDVGASRSSHHAIPKAAARPAGEAPRSARHQSQPATDLGSKLTEILDSLEGSQMAQDDRTFLLARRT